MKTEKYIPICKQVDERVKLLDHICMKEKQEGSPTPNQEWFLVFQALQDIYERLNEED